ncbi:hypothetical protein OB69_14950 [Roseivirga seohaensis subsp. aquiponti]|uniref:Uncharacterized protein n=1 Tax=Roseivirga seohaensis subsp. aquiponti TaxID=1566026 RepID=A0A0L8AHZ4_9BACT|nr:hypothetical protein [Roseivirga seohaensis]KOF02019.1 hypothetical protein OB69_14950 [Roseivirga seohaensis subsp. aquiponti]
MDIQAEKRDLIQWLSGLSDLRMIKLVGTLRKASEAGSGSKLTKAEISAIDQGLKSIKEGKVKSHEDVIKLTKKEFPNLFH